MSDQDRISELLDYYELCSSALSIYVNDDSDQSESSNLLDEMWDTKAELESLGYDISNL